MEKQKLLIAEGSDELRHALYDLFRSRYHVRCCASGYDAQKLLPQFLPDILVLDVMLPGIDGISLLQWSMGQNITPRVLVTTRIASDYVMEAVGRLGVEYIMMKPYDLGALAARIEDLSAALTVKPVLRTGPETQTSGLLLALGFRPKLRGFACLREAILLCLREEHLSVTKVLYPEVAKRCDCKSSQVERNIRSAIDAAWSGRDEAVWRLYFAPDGKGNVVRPTNAAFISRLANCIRAEKAG